MFYEEEKDNIVFDYTINSLSERQDMIDLINTVMSGETNNKLFDSKVNITAISNANE